MSPGATESGTPSTVNVTAKPFTCTSFDTVLLRVGVRMPTALAANKTTKDRRPRPQFDAVSSHRSHLVRLTEAGSDGPPGLAGITRPRACIVHVGGSRWRFRQPYGGLRCRPSVRIVVLGARGSIGGAGVPRARLRGHQYPACLSP